MRRSASGLRCSEILVRRPCFAPRMWAAAVMSHSMRDSAFSLPPSLLSLAELAKASGYMESLSVVFYLLTSLTLTLMNKLLFTQFQFPLFVTEFQVLPCTRVCVRALATHWTSHALSFIFLF